MRKDDNFYMELALEEAYKAYQIGEVPVGAVLVNEDGEVVGRGYNRTIIDNDPTSHAEVVALRNAGIAMNNYRLVNLDLYVTLEPCMMCCGAIIHARLRKVIFGAYDKKTGACGSVFDLITDPKHNHKVTCLSGILEQECSSLLSEFFKNRRKCKKEGIDWQEECLKTRSSLKKI